MVRLPIEVPRQAITNDFSKKILNNFESLEEKAIILAFEKEGVQRYKIARILIKYGNENLKIETSNRKNKGFLEYFITQYPMNLHADWAWEKRAFPIIRKNYKLFLEILTKGKKK